ncbi:MAG TPA: hypothetical protein VG015_04235, partial [Candidatus Dormibacteraeota bacterium]|nr:hypothetical protein [Candidatus Dormibacteraeota bacterium]
SVARLSLGDKSSQVWFVDPGNAVSLIGLTTDDQPIVQVQGGTDSGPEHLEIRIVRSVGQSELIYSIQSGTSAGLPAIQFDLQDSNGLWFTDPGPNRNLGKTYLFAGGNLQEVYQGAAVPRGPCL